MKTTEPRPRYVLFHRVAGGEVQSYLARAPDGERVMVHLLSASSPRGTALLEGLDRLDGDDRTHIRTVDSVDGAPVIVTDVLADFESLPTWLDSRLRPPPAPDEGEMGAAATGEGEDSGPGEFTRLFKLGGTPGDSDRPAGARSGEARSSSREDASSPRGDEQAQGEGHGDRSPGGSTDRPASDDAPGEFTRLFLAQDALGRGHEGGDEAPTGRLPADARSDSAPAGEPDRVDAPRDQDSGERPSADAGPPAGPEGPSVGADGPAAGTDEPPAEEGPSRTDPGRPPAADTPGEFTSLFSPGAAGRERSRRRDPPGWDDLRDPPGWSASPSSEASSPGDGGDDYLERLADTGRHPEAEEAGSPIEFAPMERDPVEPEAAHGPSRYTQVLAGNAPLSELPPSPPAPKASGSKPEGDSGTSDESGPPSKRPYVIAAIVIVVLAIAFIAILAWTTRGSDTEEPPAGAEEPAAVLNVSRPAAAG